MSVFDWNRVELSKIRDYGLFQWEIADHLKKVKKASENKKICPRVLCGLNNADRDHAYLDLLAEDPDAVLSGILSCMQALDTKKAELYLPENETELSKKLVRKLEDKGISLKTGIIDVREHADDFIIHIAGAADLAAVLEGKYPEGRFFKANGEMKRLDPSTLLKDVLDLSDAKAVWNGYCYLTPEEAGELTCGECPTGTVHTLSRAECIVEETKKALEEDRKISCGKCVFCREGLIQLEYEQNEITQGRGKTEYRDYAEEIGAAMHTQTLCSIGQKSAESALSAFEKFQGEYDQHIKKNNCPAGVCAAFSHLYIDPMTCTGCGECLDVCPADAIIGKPRYIHMIEDLDCTRCGKCLEVCEEGAVVRASGKLPKLPQRLVKVGKFKRH